MSEEKKQTPTQRDIIPRVESDEEDSGGSSGNIHRLPQFPPHPTTLHHPHEYQYEDPVTGQPIYQPGTSASMGEIPVGMSQVPGLRIRGPGRPRIHVSRCYLFTYIVHVVPNRLFWG